MPSIRIGYSSEFVLRNELVGIGSTATSERLDVAGQIRSENTAGSGGISTFREYQGFSQTEAELSNEVLIDNGSSGPYSSLTGKIKITGETTVSSGSTVEVGKTKTFTVTDKFSVPLGETNNRDLVPEAGTTRFNQDFGTLEFFDGANWKTVNSYSKGSAAGRAVFSSGSNTNGNNKLLKFITIPTRGNAEYFGDLSSGWNTGQHGSFSSSTRGVYFGGGGNPAASNVMEYITIPSGGGAIDFGDLVQARRACGGAGSSTRGLAIGGYITSPGLLNNIDYVEIATVGNALDFGDLRHLWITHGDTAASPTRAVILGGSGPSFDYIDEVDYINIASKGTSLNYGTWIFKGGYTSGASSNEIRAIKAGGFSFTPGGADECSLIGAITIATGGNAIEFGDLRNGPGQDDGAYFSGQGGAANGTRGIFYNGGESTTAGRAITSIELATGGAPTFFGDANQPNERFHTGVSDSHGGLGGF